MGSFAHHAISSNMQDHSFLTLHPMEPEIEEERVVQLRSLRQHEKEPSVSAWLHVLWEELLQVVPHRKCFIPH